MASSSSKPPIGPRLTAEQQSVVDAVVKHRRNVAVNSVAGSGKTTTALAAAAAFIRAHDRKVLFLVYNARIKEEIRAKVRADPEIASKVRVENYHSLARNIFLTPDERNGTRKVQINDAMIHSVLDRRPMEPLERFGLVVIDEAQDLSTSVHLPLLRHTLDVLPQNERCLALFEMLSRQFGQENVLATLRRSSSSGAANQGAVVDAHPADHWKRHRDPAHHEDSMGLPFKARPIGEEPRWSTSATALSNHTLSQHAHPSDDFSQGFQALSQGGYNSSMPPSRGGSLSQGAPPAALIPLSAHANMITTENHGCVSYSQPTVTFASGRTINAGTIRSAPAAPATPSPHGGDAVADLRSELEQRPQILIIGDPFQQIYSYMGADSQALTQPDHFFRALPIYTPSELAAVNPSPDDDIDAVALDPGQPSSQCPHKFEYLKLSICFRISHEMATFVNENLNPNTLERTYPNTWAEHGAFIKAWWGDGIRANPARQKDKYSQHHRQIPPDKWDRQFDSELGRTTKLVRREITHHGVENTVMLARSTRSGSATGSPAQRLIASLGDTCSWYTATENEINASRAGGAEINPQDGKAVFSTVHKFKGLERDLVVFVGLDGFNEPTDDKPHEVLEYFNVMYVACTRARKRLITLQMSNTPYATMRNHTDADVFVAIPKYLTPTKLMRHMIFNPILDHDGLHTDGNAMRTFCRLLLRVSAQAPAGVNPMQFLAIQHYIVSLYPDCGQSLEAPTAEATYMACPQLRDECDTVSDFLRALPTCSHEERHEALCPALRWDFSTVPCPLKAIGVADLDTTSAAATIAHPLCRAVLLAESVGEHASRSFKEYQKRELYARHLWRLRNALAGVMIRQCSGRAHECRADLEWTQDVSTVGGSTSHTELMYAQLQALGRKVADLFSNAPISNDEIDAPTDRPHRTTASSSQQKIHGFCLSPLHTLLWPDRPGPSVHSVSIVAKPELKIHVDIRQVWMAGRLQDTVEDVSQLLNSVTACHMESVITGTVDVEPLLERIQDLQAQNEEVRSRSSHPTPRMRVIDNALMEMRHFVLTFKATLDVNNHASSRTSNNSSSSVLHRECGDTVIEKESGKLPLSASTPAVLAASYRPCLWGDLLELALIDHVASNEAFFLWRQIKRNHLDGYAALPTTPPFLTQLCTNSITLINDMLATTAVEPVGLTTTWRSVRRKFHVAQQYQVDVPGFKNLGVTNTSQLYVCITDRALFEPKTTSEDDDADDSGDDGMSANPLGADDTHSRSEAQSRGSQQKPIDEDRPWLYPNEDHRHTVVITEVKVASAMTHTHSLECAVGLALFCINVLKYPRCWKGPPVIDHEGFILPPPASCLADATAEFMSKRAESKHTGALPTPAVYDVVSVKTHDAVSADFVIRAEKLSRAFSVGRNVRVKAVCVYPLLGQVRQVMLREGPFDFIARLCARTGDEKDISSGGWDLARHGVGFRTRKGPGTD